MKGCKVKEIIPVLCSDCQQNYCLRHRHPTDHHCEGKEASARKKALYVLILDFMLVCLSRLSKDMFPLKPSRLKTFNEILHIGNR